MTKQESGLVTAIKNHIILWAAVLTCVGLLVNFLSMKFLLERIDMVKCSCTNTRVEASGNHLSLFQRSDPAEQLAREILQDKGEIKK